MLLDLDWFCSSCQGFSGLPPPLLLIMVVPLLLVQLPLAMVWLALHLVYPPVLLPWSEVG